MIQQQTDPNPTSHTMYVANTIPYLEMTYFVSDCHIHTQRRMSNGRTLKDLQSKVKPMSGVLLSSRILSNLMSKMSNFFILHKRCTQDQDAFL